ncbi:MAG: DUF3536 domain-containing protein, partial [Gemmatimonadota bacterium]|nr:DUF3536 domain-containing protein [Gemmatimonadota bacterium]
LEPLQIMRYAARAIELVGADGARLEKNLLQHLAEARSSDTGAGTARDIYLRSAKPSVSPYAAIAAAHGLGRALGIGNVTCPSCAVCQDGETTVVCERETGRDHVFEVGVLLGGGVEDEMHERIHDAAIRVQTVGAFADDALYLKFEDLPESARTAFDTISVARDAR